MNKTTLALIRHMLTLTGSAIVAKGITNSATVEILIGFIVTLIAMIWSVKNSRKPHGPRGADGSVPVRTIVRTLAPVFALAAVLAFVAGCAFNRQFATTTTTSTNGVSQVTVARSTTIAAGDAKTIIDKTRASAGKTSTVGASGLQEEATTGNVATNARALVDLLNALKSP